MSTENLDAGPSPGEGGQAGLFAQSAVGTEANDHHAAPEEAAAEPQAEHAEEAEASAANGAAHEAPSAAAEDGQDGDAAEGAKSAAQAAVDAVAGSGHHTTAAPQPAAVPAIRIQPDEDEPYDFKNCTVTINIQLLPDDGHEDGREVIVSVSSHIEGPLIEIMRLRELEPFAQPILAMLKEHEERLPALGEARANLREQERTKSSSAKSKTTVRTTARQSSVARPSSGSAKGGSSSGEQTTLFNLSTGHRPSSTPAGAQAGGK